MSLRISGWATASRNTKRREPRPRLTAIGRGEPSPRLKPDGLSRLRPATANPSGRGASASARTPRVARTRKRGEPCVDCTKRLRDSTRIPGSVRSQGLTQSRRERRGSMCGSADTAREVSLVSGVAHMSAKRRGGRESLFVFRRAGEPLSCRTEGARSCRRGRENPKGEAARAAGDAAGIRPDGVRVASTAPRAVSRRRRFVVARSAEAHWFSGFAASLCGLCVQSLCELCVEGMYLFKCLKDKKKGSSST